MVSINDYDVGSTLKSIITSAYYAPFLKKFSGNAANQTLLSGFKNFEGSIIIARWGHFQYVCIYVNN